jgi:hypothetical protein
MKYCGTSGTARQATDSNIVCKLQEYRHIHVLFNTHCFCMATMVTQICLNNACVVWDLVPVMCGLLSRSNICLPQKHAESSSMVGEFT